MIYFVILTIRNKMIGKNIDKKAQKSDDSQGDDSLTTFQG